MPNFEEILDKTVGEVEKPPPKPGGTYLAAIVGLPTQNKIGQEEHSVVDFRIKLIQAGDDVDRDQMELCGPLADWAPVQDRHWVNTEQAVYYFSEFLKNVLDFQGLPIRQALAQCPGKQYMVTMKQRPFVNREGKADISFDVDSRAHI